VSSTEVTGKTYPLPKTIDEGMVGLGGQKRLLLPRSGVL
jgi:hypothetical protein